MKTKLFAGAILTAALALGTSQAASAGNGGSYFFNMATSINAFHGQQFHVAFDIDQTQSNWVNTTNRSYAWTTHCAGCKTAAIAFQIVVAPLGGSINSDNEAKAVEDHCINCSNLASSYQFILTEPNPQISSATRQALYGVQGQLYALQWSGLTGDALQAAIDQLAGQVEYDLLAGAAQPAPMAAAARLAAPLVVTQSPQLTVNRQAQSE